MTSASFSKYDMTYIGCIKCIQKRWLRILPAYFLVIFCVFLLTTYYCREFDVEMFQIQIPWATIINYEVPYTKLIFFVDSVSFEQTYFAEFFSAFFENMKK